MEILREMISSLTLRSLCKSANAGKIIFPEKAAAIVAHVTTTRTCTVNNSIRKTVCPARRAVGAGERFYTDKRLLVFAPLSWIIIYRKMLHVDNLTSLIGFGSTRW
jgi:hypothetical protein